MTLPACLEEINLQNTNTMQTVILDLFLYEYRMSITEEIYRMSVCRLITGVKHDITWTYTGTVVDMSNLCIKNHTL